MASLTPKYFVLRPEEFRDVRTLCLEGEFAPWIHPLAGSPNLEQVTHLSLKAGDLDPVALVQALAGSPHLSRLTSLSLRDCNLSTEAVAVLAGAPLLARLTALDLGRNTVGADGLRALLESPHFRELRALDVSGWEEEWRDWAGGSLTHPSIETAGVLALAASPAAIRLTRLNLALNCIQADGFRAIVASPYLANLVVLNVFERSLYDLSIDAAVVEVLKARFGQGMSFEVEG